MQTDVKEALFKLTGEDEEATEKFAELVDNTNLTIDQERLVTREDEAEPEAEIEEEEVEEDAEEEAEPEEEVEEEPEEVEQFLPEIGELELDDEAVERIADVAAESLGPMFAKRDAKIEELLASIAKVKEMVEGLTDLPERVDALEMTDEEKREVWLEDQPKKKDKVVVSYRPREAKKESGEDPSLSEVAKETLEHLPKYS